MEWILFEQLQQRWFVNQRTSDTLFELYQKGWQTLYFGMDPTADSLHLGNLINFMSAINFLLHWNKLIIIIGGATGMIGDPGGKDSERSFLDVQKLAYNVKSITEQVNIILHHLEMITGQQLLDSVQVVDNMLFYERLSYIDFLRDIGKYITVNSMMTRDTVKKRLTEAGKYISYTEFSYMLMQGYDFYRLYTDHQVRLQIAWSDQRGNITMGTELIRKLSNGEAYGLTSPLILASNGKKFGKSEWNALRLDPNKTSISEMYNYFYNADDQDVGRYLKLLTLYSLTEIDAILAQHQSNTQARYGQKKLAQGIMTILYGQEKSNKQLKLSTYTKWDPQECQECLSMWLYTDLYPIHSMELIDILMYLWRESSRSSAKQSIISGAISLNGTKITNIAYQLSEQDFNHQVAVIRKWKHFPKFITNHISS